MNTNFNNAQFGQLRLGEKSIRSAVANDMSSPKSLYPRRNPVDQIRDYRALRQRFKAPISLLDRAGLDIEIRGHQPDSEMGLAHDLDMPVIEARLLDKNKNVRYSVLETTQESPLDVICKIIAEGVNRLTVADDADVSLNPPKRHEDPTNTWTSTNVTMSRLQRLISQIKTNHAVGYKGWQED